MRSRSLFKSVAALAALALAAVSCGSSDDISFEDAWARPTAPAATTAAFYGTLQNSSDSSDRLVGMSSPACGTVEMHQSSMNDGVMTMRPASDAARELGADEQLKLEPGGYHLMCLDLIEPLIDGNSTRLTLEFEQSGDITIELPIEHR